MINLLTSLKEEFPWLKEAVAQNLQQSIADLDTAFQRFFKEVRL